MSRIKEYFFEQKLEQFKKRIGENKYEPSESELRGKSEKKQTEIILRWFLDRYCDPALETPYVGEEGGYMYIWGGPFDPNDEIPERFGGIASEGAIAAAIDRLVDEVGTEWAPIEHVYDEDYDEDYAIPEITPRSSLARFEQHLGELKDVLAASDENWKGPTVRPLVYAAAIGALESHLYEVASNLLTEHPTFGKNLITRGALFKEEKIGISEIYKIHDNMDKKILGHFQNMVWHRWKDVETFLKAGLGIDIEINERLNSHTLTRHDITHRSSKTKTGEVVEITSPKTLELISLVNDIAQEINSKIDEEAKARNGVLDGNQPF